MEIIRLNDDVMGIIFKHLDFISLSRSRVVCKQWKEVIKDIPGLDLQSSNTICDIEESLKKLNKMFRAVSLSPITYKCYGGHYMRQASEHYYVKGIRHCGDGPAMINHDKGIKIYYKNGKKHNDKDEPAYISSTKRCYYKHGKLHRIKGPAVIYYKDRKPTGEEEWRRHGKFHRMDGPAHISRNKGVKVYYINGKKHRIDGPAYIDRTKEEWYFEDKLHCDDGPAVIFNPMQSYSVRVWYNHGQYLEKQGEREEEHKYRNEMLIRRRKVFWGEMFNDKSEFYIGGDMKDIGLKNKRYLPVNFSLT